MKKRSTKDRGCLPAAAEKSGEAGERPLPVRVTSFDPKSREITVRAFVKTDVPAHEVEHRVYMTHERVRRDPTLREQSLRMALEELWLWFERHRMYKELKPLLEIVEAEVPKLRKALGLAQISGG